MNDNRNQSSNKGSNDMTVEYCREIIKGCMPTAEAIARPGTDIKMMSSYFIAAFTRDWKCGANATDEQVRTAFYDMVLWGIPTDNTHARLEGRGGKNPSLSYVVDTAGYMAILASIPQVDEVFTVSIFTGDKFTLPSMFTLVDDPPFEFTRGDFEQRRERQEFIAAIACLRIRGERYWRFEIMDANEFDKRDAAADRKTNRETAYDMWTEQTARTKALKKLFENLLVNWSLRGLITVQNLIQECDVEEHIVPERIGGLGGIEKMPGDTNIPERVHGGGAMVDRDELTNPDPEPGEAVYSKGDDEQQGGPEPAAIKFDVLEHLRDLAEMGAKACASEDLRKEMVEYYEKATTKTEIESHGKTVGSLVKKKKLAAVDIETLQTIHRVEATRVLKIENDKAKADKAKAKKKTGKKGGK